MPNQANLFLNDWIVHRSLDRFVTRCASPGRSKSLAKIMIYWMNATEQYWALKFACNLLGRSLTGRGAKGSTSFYVTSDFSSRYLANLPFCYLLVLVVLAVYSVRVLELRSQRTLRWTLNRNSQSEPHPSWSRTRIRNRESNSTTSKITLIST